MDTATAPAPVVHSDNEQTFSIEMLRVGSQLLRVGRRPASRARSGAAPLLLFNGIGGNIELLGPFVRRMPEREAITFDVPGVGHSLMPPRPYRPGRIVQLACSVLDHYGHPQADVLGVSWGGGIAQQFARTASERCRRLVLCATAPGVVMVPSRPGVMLKMATPRRYMSKSYALKVAGHIYGGDFRRDPDLVAQLFRHVRWQSRLGYYLQLGAIFGWTSIHWLHRITQPTLVMAGRDDPLVPLANARLMHVLIPNSELVVFNCGHLFLLTRGEQAAAAIRAFLDRP
ncbi:MAG TPA: poly(3-hydroxyalkanoate) depolymerase [Burkholderiaceae bacterium]|nr:poly(3-hydroxyalkanoate) depolymerase [Burkholderiaceae bacterium]